MSGAALEIRMLKAGDQGVVVGFVSAVQCFHPDKPPQFWINEVSVAPAHQRKGLAKALLAHVQTYARQLGCSEPWVLTDDTNAPARALYRSPGGEETQGVVMVTFPLSK